jgi:hypothetical protein
MTRWIYESKKNNIFLLFFQTKFYVRIVDVFAKNIYVGVNHFWVSITCHSSKYSVNESLTKKNSVENESKIKINCWSKSYDDTNNWYSLQMHSEIYFKHMSTYDCTWLFLIHSIVRVIKQKIYFYFVLIF